MDSITSPLNETTKSADTSEHSVDQPATRPIAPGLLDRLRLIDNYRSSAPDDFEAREICLKNMTADVMEVGAVLSCEFREAYAVGGDAVEQIPAVVAQLLQVGKTVAQLLALEIKSNTIEPHELRRIPR
jgi:hypothetical protein